MVMVAILWWRLPGAKIDATPLVTSLDGTYLAISNIRLVLIVSSAESIGQGWAPSSCAMKGLPRPGGWDPPYELFGPLAEDER